MNDLFSFAPKVRRFLYNSATFSYTSQFKDRLLHWGNQFKFCTLFNPNNSAKYPFQPFKHFLAVGHHQLIFQNGHNPFDALKEVIETNNKWLVGHLSYDLKNHLENLSSSHESIVTYPLIGFFEACHLIFIDENNNKVEILSQDDPEDIHEDILAFNQPHPIKPKISDIKLKTSRNEYITTVEKLIRHIEEGDIYEINYCIDYVIEELILNPVEFYKAMCQSSPTPFSSFYKIGDQYALGASPERFLRKTGNQVISQPIKGTAKRGASNDEDHKIIDALRHDEKERAENMMIVDLVRNDLARSAQSGTVKVEEFFGIYSFKHWHQMISTVSAQLRPQVQLVEIIKNAFPMGSMTGAPKIKVMQLIEQYETFKRGLYSGSIGYITPDKDFDFNVVIRTLFYDKEQSKGTFMVGSAITYDAIPSKEYEECLLKAKAIIETLYGHCD